MKFLDIFNSETQVCFVFPFQFNLSCFMFDDKDNEVQYDFDRWKENVSSVLIGDNNSSNSCCLFSWEKVVDNSSDSSNYEFLPNCFLKGKIADSAKEKCCNDYLCESLFKEIGLEVNLVEIKLWEFGFGSIKIVLKATSNLLNDKEKLLKEVLDDFQTMSKEQFSKILKPKIDCEIIRRCNLQRKSNPEKITSFAEIVLQHKNENYLKSDFDLLDPIIIVKSEVKDESNEQYKGELLSFNFHTMKIKNNMLEIYFSDNKKLLISMSKQHLGESNKIDEIMETVLIHKDFANYCNSICQAYEAFLSSYHDIIANKSMLPQILGPTKSSFAWNWSIEKKCINAILTEIHELSRINTMKFNTFDKHINNYLSHSNSNIFKYTAGIFELNGLRDSNEVLLSFVNDRHAKISNWNYRLTSIFGGTIVVSSGMILAILSVILSTAGITIALNPPSDQFQIDASLFLNRWLLPIILAIGVFTLIVQICRASNAEYNEISDIKKKDQDIKTHQLWIKMSKDEKTIRQTICQKFAFWKK